MSTLQQPLGRRPSGQPSLARDVVVTVTALGALVFGTLLLPSAPDDGAVGRPVVSGRD